MLFLAGENLCEMETFTPSIQNNATERLRNKWKTCIKFINSTSSASPVKR